MANELIKPIEQVDRASYLGSADIANIFGLEDSFGSPYDTWARKIGLIGSVEMTEAMAVGLVLEGYILQRYSREEGSTVSAQQVFFRHPDYEFLGCTVDGLCFDQGKPVRIVEAKTTRDWKWDEVPLRYEAQVQWQMGISGIHEADLAVLHRPDLKLQTYRMQFDSAIFDALFDKALDFWFGHVETKLPPAVDGAKATGEALKQIIGMPGEEVSIDSLADRLEALKTIKLQKKELETAEEAVLNELRLAMGSAEIGTIDGKPAFTLKTTKGKVTVDSKALQSKFPEAFEACKKIGNDYRTPRIMSMKD